MNSPLNQTAIAAKPRLGVHTPGPWLPGKHPHTIVSESFVGDGPRGWDDVSYYGGYLIAESVATCNLPVMAAAPVLLDVLQDTAAMLRLALPGLPMDARFIAASRADAAERLVEAILRGEWP